MQEEGDNKLMLHKIIVVGESGVGKTSVINRYVHGFFSKMYKSTIGVDFALKEVDVDDNHVKLQLWDIAGQERYNTLTHIYYRSAVGAIVVFDLSKEETFNKVNHWKKDIDEKVFLDDGGENERSIPCILLANKCDLHYQEELVDELDGYCEQQNFRKWFKTSALKNEGIDEAMMYLIRQINEEKKKDMDKKTDDMGEDDGLIRLKKEKENEKKREGEGGGCQC